MRACVPLRSICTVIWCGTSTRLSLLRGPGIKRRIRSRSNARFLLVPDDCATGGIGLQVGLHEIWQPREFLGNLLGTLVCIAQARTHAMHAKQCLVAARRR